jgi:hypothetical protein
MIYPVRMQHPNYGFHHAYDWAEKAKMEKSGWTVEGAEPEKAFDPFEEMQQVAEVTVKRKPGRPPKDK